MSAECEHLLMYVTPLGGLDGLYWRCRDCLEYWRLNPYEEYKDFPQRVALGVDQDPKTLWWTQATEDMQRITESGEDLSEEPDDWGMEEHSG